MSSLAHLPEVVGFFSYSRDDDKAFKGALSALRKAIHEDLSAKLGRFDRNFRLWQDQEAIDPGELWELKIKAALDQAVFFIPIVTPRAVNSRYCKFEFEAFLARELTLGRADLVFPLLYINVPELENEAEWRKDPVLSIIGERQYVDWRAILYLDINTPAVRETVGRFCDKIVQALRKPWVSPEERRRQQDMEAQQRAEAMQKAAAAELHAEAEWQAAWEKRRAEGARLAEEE
jgi:TIR domain